jgi:hypothetical protein
MRSYNLRVYSLQSVENAALVASIADAVLAEAAEAAGSFGGGCDEIDDARAVITLLLTWTDTPRRRRRFKSHDLETAERSPLYIRGIKTAAFLLEVATAPVYDEWSHLGYERGTELEGLATLLRNSVVG